MTCSFQNHVVLFHHKCVQNRSNGDLCKINNNKGLTNRGRGSMTNWKLENLKDETIKSFFVLGNSLAVAILMFSHIHDLFISKHFFRVLFTKQIINKGLTQDRVRRDKLNTWKIKSSKCFVWGNSLAVAICFHKRSRLSLDTKKWLFVANKSTRELWRA